MKPFTVEHAQRLKFVRHAGLVPGSRYGYYVVSETPDHIAETHGLWLFERDGSGSHRIGERLGDVRAVSAAPDGRALAVIAGGQIHLLQLVGGDVRRLTALEQGVSGAPVWSPDGRSLAFTARATLPRDPKLPYRIDRLTYRWDGLGYLDDVVQNLYIVDVATGDARRLQDDRRMHLDPRWSPDGRALCCLVSFDPQHDHKFMADIQVIDVRSGRSRSVLGDWGGAFAAEWSADGRRIVFVGNRASDFLYATEKGDLWTVDLEGGEPECRTADVHAGVHTSILADVPNFGELSEPRIRIVGDAAYVGGQAGADAVIHRIRLTGPQSAERVIATPGTSAYLFDADPRDGLLYQATSFLEPPELVLDSRRITSLNDELLSSVERPALRPLEVVASDGLRTDGWALTPPGPGPWPAVLCVHGGPYGSWGSTYSIDFHLLVGAGFAVILNNFRGSGGYGSEFGQKITGEWGRSGSLDHHAAVDAAIAAGVADPERLGVFGLSHGGFATCWLVGTSDRFKAAVAENPVTSFASFYGNADTSFWIPPELGGTPLDVPDVYHERSSLTYASNCRTPLLFIVGESDMRCHPMESEQYYRVVKSNGVPTEMLRLPNCAHLGSWTGPVPARVAQNRAIVEWFGRYLGDRSPA